MVTTLNRQNSIRLDAVPTEVQMKLGISQVLSMPFAYNSPVIVLDFEVGNKNIIKGRFKDAIRSRVFEFEIGDSITFKPFAWKRTDNPVAWEDFSKGYSYRYDAVKTPRKEKPKCGNTSYNCGKACIGLNKNCKSDPPDKPSQEKVDKLRAAAGEFKAVQGDPTKKQEDNKLTPKPPEVKAVKTKTAKGAGGKSVDQQYKDIIASSKDPKGTEEVLSSALRGGFGDFERKNYNEYSTAIKSGTVPKGMGNYYQKQVDKYKPIIEAEDFINERKKKAISGDYETEQEAGIYVLNKLKQKGYKEHEYYDSSDYEKDYGKLVGVMKSVKLPPPLSGIVPGKELKQTLTPGDKLLVKEDTYSLMSSGNTPTGYRIVDGGEVLKVNVKNVKTRVRGEYMGKPYENEPSLALDKVTHVIRDGKRYKVDDSDSSPNDLKPESSKSQKAVKQKAVKQKTIKVQGERSQKQESPLIPKEEIVKDAPKLIGDGTHEGAPKNAQEYYDAAVKTGKAMTMKEAEDTVAAVSGWSRSSNDIRNDQKKGKFNKKAELISDYVRNSTPYNGDIHRGIVFNNREEAMEWIKGDENGVLDNQNAHASWTSKESVAWVYTNPMMRKANKTLAGVIVSSVNKTGASIEKLSRYKESEAEVLVAKDARHKVKSVTEKDGILYVQTEEI
jgi:hypothetical protein